MTFSQPAPRPPKRLSPLWLQLGCLLLVNSVLHLRYWPEPNKRTTTKKADTHDGYLRKVKSESTNLYLHLYGYS